MKYVSPQTEKRKKQQQKRRRLIMAISAVVIVAAVILVAAVSLLKDKPSSSDITESLPNSESIQQENSDVTENVSSEIIEPDFPDLQKERSAKMNLYKIFTFLCINVRV